MLVPMRQNKKIPSRDEYNRTTLIYLRPAIKANLYYLYWEKRQKFISSLYA